MIYKLCKKEIENGNYKKEDMQKKLDLFLLKNRISEEEYTELIAMIN